jgi:hypothetical protein
MELDIGKYCNEVSPYVRYMAQLLYRYIFMVYITFVDMSSLPEEFTTKKELVMQKLSRCFIKLEGQMAVLIERERVRVCACVCRG